jgi:hypothetical protein
LPRFLSEKKALFNPARVKPGINFSKVREILSEKLIGI